ncbi:MAG: VCBS repeat-containing protein [Planctomycetes bacterium]|nr:VCBS repeat-containing protein [Planctomycetota bacterium]
MHRILLNLLWPLLCGALSAQVSSVNPQANTCDASLDNNIVITLATAAPNPDVRVHTRLRGKVAGNCVAAGNTWVFDPAVDFLPGEEVEVSVPAYNFAYRFTARTRAVTPVFDTYKRQYNTNTHPEVYAVRCGDMDGDGDIDIVLGRMNAANHIYFNDGTGNFPQSATWGGATDQVQDLALADVDSDGDLDMVVAINPGRNLLYLNNGSGQLGTPVQLNTTDTDSIAVTVGDLDGDGDLDIVFANGGINAAAAEIYYNSGTTWTPGIIDVYPGANSPTTHNAWDVALGDMDADGDLDLVFAVFALFSSDKSVIYFNDGQGAFSSYVPSGTSAVPAHKFFGYSDQNMSVALGDLDGDGDLDIALGTNGGTVPDPRLACLWQNDGTGTMTLYGQTGMFTSEYDQTWHCQFVDFDGDHDWDLGITNSNYVTSQFGGSWRTQTLCNTGGGVYVNGYGVGNLTDVHYGMDYADMDNDGDLDMVLRDWLHLNGSTPPMINVRAGSNWLTDGDTVNVAYNSTLAALNIQVNVGDPDSSTIDLLASISSVTTQGLLVSEFSATAAGVPCNLYPTSGTFNVGGTTHTVQLTADDGTSQTVFTFHLAVGAPPPPVIAVSEQGGAGIAHGASATGGRDFGTQDEAAGATTALGIVISNSGPSVLNISGVTLGGANPGDFVLNTTGMAGSVANGTSTSFSIAFDPTTAGAKTATVQIAHDDPNQPNPFTFEIAGVGTVTVYAPILVVRDSNGAIIANGGSRAFGALVVGQSAAMAIRVENAGNADLHVGVPALSGAHASQWVLDTTGMTSTLAPGAYTTFTLSFSPQASGVFAASMTLTHDDSSQATPFALAVSGTAAADGANSGSGGSDSNGGGGGCAVAGGGLNLLALLLLVLAVFCIARSHRQRA